jgi:DNA-binding winged helix-turn-helix (wHTH) protein/WD40 repeat protein
MAEDNHSLKTRFGVFEFDPQSREVTKHGVRLKLQEQPIQILAALLEQAGQIVPREELQRRLWPDGTFVDYEQSLNKAVNKLREALGDSANNPVYIETLARRGYRFVAPVDLERPKQAEPAIEDTIQESNPLPSRSRLWRRALALGLVAAAVWVTGLWPVAAPKVRVTQLTRGGRRGTGALAVHGGRILYVVWGMGSGCCWSVSTEGGESRWESMPFLDQEQGTNIAQVEPRQGVILIYNYRAPPGDLWLAGFDGSKPRRIGESVAGNGYSVSPDLKTLLRSGKEGLFARPVDGGPERLVARIGWSAPSGTFWHPSGERIGFMLYKDGKAKAWEVKTDGTGMRPLLPEFQEEQGAFQWSPDGKRLYFLSQGEIYMRGGRHWLGWIRTPQPAPLTGGSVRFFRPIEDPTDPRVVYAMGWVLHGESMKLNRQSGIFEPYLEGLSATCLDYSPDGQWIAYVSYPDMELWKCRRDGSDRVLLQDSMYTYMPRWSPDGKRLAFAAIRKGESGLYRIYIMPAAVGKAELVKGVNGPGFDPNWSPDGKKLVFAPFDMVGRVPKQQQHVSIVDLDTGLVQMVPGSENLFSPRWSPDGQHLVALSGERGHVFIYDFASRLWADVPNDIGFPAWSKDSRYVYGNRMSTFSLLRLEVATRKVEEIRRIKEFRVTGSLGWGVSWTPDGEPVVLSDLSAGEVYRMDVQW